MANILSNKFQSAARSALNTGCADGARVTREDVSAALAAEGYTVSPKLVGTLVESGELNTSTKVWELFRGRYGGIREVDMVAYQEQLDTEAARVAKKAERAAKKAAAQAPEAPAASETEVEAVAS